MKLPLIRSLSDLQTVVNKGNRPKYLCFWGHTPKSKAQIDQSCLSNWFPARFKIDQISYRTAEQYMMAEKAALFNNQNIREDILNSKSPAQVKSLGRKVINFEQQVWNKHRYKIVVEGCYAKFAQNLAMREYLLNTHDRVLVEASPVDRIWGIGLAADHGNAQNPNKWRGLNLLGFALMEVRDRLKE